LTNTGAILLSGGRGSRLGGIEKGLAPLAGRVLIEWVIERIAPQVSELVISANHQINTYRALNWPVVADTLPDQQGPLAGILAAATALKSEWLLIVPCDTPFLPPDLVTQLAAATAHDTHLARATDAEQAHYAIMRLHRCLLPDMAAFLAKGQRSVQRWQARHSCAEARFPDPEAFANLNTPEDLARAEARLRTA